MSRSTGAGRVSDLGPAPPSAVHGRRWRREPPTATALDTGDPPDEHHLADPDPSQVVPSSWRRGGPFQLAGDISRQTHGHSALGSASCTDRGQPRTESETVGHTAGLRVVQYL
jgi:hypothetical protein